MFYETDSDEFKICDDDSSKQQCSNQDPVKDVIIGKSSRKKNARGKRAKEEAVSLTF